MYKQLLLVLIVSFINLHFNYCQKEAEETYKEMFLDGEYFLLQEEYLDALSFYQKLYKRGFDNNANVNYRLGICYLNIPGQKNLSVSYLEKAAEKADKSYKEGVFKQDLAPLDVFIYLGNAFRVNNKLDEAISTYKKYLSVIDEKKEVEKNYANHQIQACLTAKEMQKTPVDIKFANEGNMINSGSSNYCPVVSGDGNSLVYMFELPFYDAIYYSVKKDGIWSKPRNITPEIQSDGDLFTRSISLDGKKLILAKESSFNSDIWISNLGTNGKWTPALPLSKNINTKYWESHASLSPDSKRLYFASNRKGGFGQMDIYYSDLNADNEWSEPINIGDVINTNLNEDSPVLSPDGRKLYFSSQGHLCMGGYDLFVSEINEKGIWSEPKNLGYPLNTTDDELFYYPTARGNIGYIALYTDQGFGREDIYRVNFSDKKEEIIAETNTQEVIQEDELVEEKEIIEEIKPEPVKEIVEVKEIIQEEVKKPVEETKPVEEVKQTEKTKPVEEKVLTINVKPLLFAFNSVGLSPESVKMLNEIADLMSEFSEINLELNGYADSKGSDEINQIISRQRAESAREYLIRKEVGQSRIKINAFGNTNFVAININPDGTDNPEGRKYNRRVEIKLVNTNNNINVSESNIIPNHLKIKD